MLLYDLATDGFNFWHALGLAFALVLVAFGVHGIRRNDRGRRFFILYTTVGVAFSAMLFVALVTNYVDYRHDVDDLRAGRAAVVEGEIHDMDRRRGVERFVVGDVPMFSRGVLEGYGMPTGLPIGDGLRVRAWYGRSEAGRHRVLRLEVTSAAPAAPRDRR